MKTVNRLIGQKIWFWSTNSKLKQELMQLILNNGYATNVCYAAAASPLINCSCVCNEVTNVKKTRTEKIQKYVH